MASRWLVWSVVDSLNLRRSAMLARYGPPLSTRTHAFSSQLDPGQVDSLVTLRFANFESMYHVRYNGVYSLSHVTIFEPVAGIPAEARPGVSLTNLIAYLGMPDERSNEDEGLLLLFELKPEDDDGWNVLNVMVADGRVKWVSWIFFPEVWWQPD